MRTLQKTLLNLGQKWFGKKKKDGVKYILKNSLTIRKKE